MSISPCLFLAHLLTSSCVLERFIDSHFCSNSHSSQSIDWGGGQDRDRENVQTTHRKVPNDKEVQPRTFIVLTYIESSPQRILDKVVSCTS